MFCQQILLLFEKQPVDKPVRDWLGFRRDRASGRTAHTLTLRVAGEENLLGHHLLDIDRPQNHVQLLEFDILHAAFGVSVDFLRQSWFGQVVIFAREYT